MCTPPTAMIQTLAPCAPLFSECVWQHAQVLLKGAILAPSKRIVAAALGLALVRNAHKYGRQACSGDRGCWWPRSQPAGRAAYAWELFAKHQQDQPSDPLLELVQTAYQKQVAGVLYRKRPSVLKKKPSLAAKSSSNDAPERH